MDPKHGWSYHADPLPALDTYTRHTVAAQYIYGLLGPQGLRIMTPMVVYIEMFAAPVALVGSYLGNTFFIHLAIGLICSLHVGISMALRNAVLLSFVACAAWFVFLPLGWTNSSSRRPSTFQSKLGLVVSTLLVGSMVSANIWFETIGKDCSTGSLREIWSTLLQNRWNVFIGAEEYVCISWSWTKQKGFLWSKSGCPSLTWFPHFSLFVNIVILSVVPLFLTNKKIRHVGNCSRSFGRWFDCRCMGQIGRG